MVGAFPFLDHVGPLYLAGRVGLERCCGPVPTSGFRLPAISMPVRPYTTTTSRRNKPSVLAKVNWMVAEHGARFLYWNLFAGRRRGFEQAKPDSKAGRLKPPDLEHHEFMPLPEQPGGVKEGALFDTFGYRLSHNRKTNSHFLLLIRPSELTEARRCPG